MVAAADQSDMGRMTQLAAGAIRTYNGAAAAAASTFWRPLVTDPTSSFESASVAAVLAQRCREDRAALLDDLVTMLAEIVPGVQVDRSLLRRHVTAIRIPLGSHVYSLERGAHDSFDASRRQQVRGVVIRTEPLELDAFLAKLGVALEVELQRTERGRDAVRGWLDAPRYSPDKKE